MKECENCFKKIKGEDIVVVEDYSWFCSEECCKEYFEEEDDE